jgi:hypothetical protein
MNQKVTYFSAEGIRKRLYWPVTFLFSGTVLVWCLKSQILTVVALTIMHGKWVLAPLFLIALGIWGLVSALSSFFLKLPRLTLTKEGIKFERFLSTWFITWNELGPFDLPFGRDIEAKILSGRHKRQGRLLIPVLNIDKLELFDQLNEWRTKALEAV